MTRKLHIGLLVIALIFEVGLTGMSFFAREATLRQLHLAMNGDTEFLGYIVAWFCLFVSLVCGYVLWLVVKNNGAVLKGQPFLFEKVMSAWVIHNGSVEINNL